MSNEINLFDVLIAAGFVQGFFFFFTVWLSKKYTSSANRYLALTVLFLSLNNLQYWLISTYYINSNLQNLFYLPWQWLIMPMFYIYTVKYLKIKENVISLKYLLAPFFIIFILHSTLLIVNYNNTESFIYPKHFENGFYLYLEYFSVIFNISIIIFTYRVTSNYEVLTKNKNVNWLKQLVVIAGLLCSIWFIAIVTTSLSNTKNKPLFYLLWIGISITIYYLGYKGLNEWLLQKKNRAKRKISESGSTSIYLKFDNLIESERLYLNPSISLEELAIKLDVSKNYLSQIINMNSSENFNEIINRKRVAQAKIWINDPNYKNYTLTAIGMESGFNSKTSFYRSFKKFEGMSPSCLKK